MAVLFTMNADITDFKSPDFVGAVGVRIHFDLQVSGLIVVSDTLRPSLLNVTRTTGYIRSDGRMYSTESTLPIEDSLDLEDPVSVLGVRLVGNDPDLNLDGDVTYEVSGTRLVYGHPTVVFEPFNTGPVSATDTSMDLASVAPGGLVIG